MPMRHFGRTRVSNACTSTRKQVGILSDRETPSEFKAPPGPFGLYRLSLRLFQFDRRVCFGIYAASQIDSIDHNHI